MPTARLATRVSPGESRSRKAAAAAATGNAIEWFDFGIFGFLVTILGAQFFPRVDPSMRTVHIFIVFAAGFLLRPVGALLFGPLGDRIGRRNILAVTILLMAGSTLMVGLLPTYKDLGIWAAVLLATARMLQGFSAGGEYAGAATFIAEYAPDRKRGFLGSWLEFGTLAGFTSGAVLVTSLTLTLPPDAMNNWGWRIPFLAAFPLGLFGLYLRLRMEETPTFQECVAAHDIGGRSPLREVAARHWPEMVLCFGLVVLLNIVDYTLLIYLKSHLTVVLAISEETALLMICGVLLAMMVVIIPLGALSDRIGRKPLLFTSGLGFLSFSYLAFWLLSRGSWTLTLLGLAIIGFLQVCYLAIVGSVLPAIFETRVRYTGFAISYNLSTAIFAGTAPLLIGLLQRFTDNPYIPAFYLMFAAAVSLVAMLFVVETAGRPLRGTEAAARRPAHRDQADPQAS